jgi:hypothetical protein
VHKLLTVTVLAIALTCTAASLSAQVGGPSRAERLRTDDRRVIRANVAVIADRSYGVEGDFGVTGRTSIVAAVRRWQPGYSCADSGPVLNPDGSLPPPSPRPCTPEGWSASGGLRGRLGIAFAEVDLGVYRYDNRSYSEQRFVAPYGGVRAGVAPRVWSAGELQIGIHLISISSYNRYRFELNSWQLGGLDVGFGIQL